MTLLELKTSAVTATAFAFFRLTDNNGLMASCEKGSNRFSNDGDIDQQTFHDFDKFVQKKCSSNFPRFCTNWRSLAAKLSELLDISVELTSPGLGSKTV